MGKSAHRELQDEKQASWDESRDLRTAECFAEITRLLSLDMSRDEVIRAFAEWAGIGEQETVE